MYSNDLRFPPDPDKYLPIPLKPITYTLPPEEIQARYGHLPKNPGYRKPSLTKEKIIKLLESGHTAAEIAANYRYPQAIVEHIASLYGIELDKHGRKVGKEKPRRTGTKLEKNMRLIPREKLVEMRAGGMSFKEIAEEIGVEAEEVRYLAREYAV